MLSRIRSCPRPFTLTFCEPRLLAGLVLDGAEMQVKTNCLSLTFRGHSAKD